MQDLWKVNSAGYFQMLKADFFFLTKIFFSIEVKTRPLHVYTFSVITKNTFVRQTWNSLQMYICYKYFLHFIIYMALKHNLLKLFCRLKAGHKQVQFCKGKVDNPPRDSHERHVFYSSWSVTQIKNEKLSNCSATSLNQRPWQQVPADYGVL